MEWNKLIFLVPYLLALAITTSVFFYAWRHRHIRGGGAYTWYVAGQVLWTGGFVVELLNPTVQGKIFWDGVQWIAGFFILVAFPVFAVQYTDYELKRPRLTWGLASIIPILMMILVLTDSQHHLIYSDPHLINDSIFPELNYKFTWVVYGYAIYSYLVTFTGLGLLIRRIFRPHRLYRSQILTVAIGFFIPVVFTILTVAGVDFKPYRDVSILTFALGNIIIAWGLFRYKLFNTVPIARDIVVENMDDIVVVLDTQDHVIDINQIALTTLNLSSSQVIGKSANIVFTDWPELIQQFDQPTKSLTKKAIVTYEKHFYYEVKSTMLYNKRKHYIGRIFVARNVTERIDLQNGLEKLNKELEERVAKRTEELRKSAERYRAVVENQTEFIVRWKLDGSRTFVNDAYLNYFGLTPEQAISTDFLPLIAEEDRHAVKEKIARLMSGEVDAETDIHRVIMPDGNIGWQEWTDQVIRDEIGKVVEFQSVGRDITERKQAEEALQNSEDRYRRLAENAPDIIFRYALSPTPKLEYINPAVERISGYAPEDCYADPLLMLNMAHPEDAHLMAELMQSLGPLNEPIIMRWIGKDGEVRWMESRLVPVYDEANQLVAVEGLTRDITERKRTEETILKQLAFEELMTAILTRFATCSHDEIDASIQEALQKIATFMKVERAYVIIIDPEHRKTWSITHEWCAPQIPQRIAKRQNIPFGTFPWNENSILTGNVSKINTLDDYPSEDLADRDVHIAEGTQSILNVPIRGSDGQISGCIGGQTYSYSLTWSDDDVNHLKMVGDAIANLLERKRAEEMLLSAYDATLEGWAKALELRDKETEDHSRRVIQLTFTLAQAMGFQGEDLTHIRRGAILHDIGKMGIPDEILRKRGELTVAERKIVERHPIHSYKLLSQIQFLEKALDIPYCHHEHWDGSGYPRGLKGEEIPLAARIFSVIDVWDAVQSDRPYNRAWPKDKTIQYLKDESGKYFDPECVSVFLELVEQGKI